MEHLIEGILEFLFRFIKFETKQMPQNTGYRENFKISINKKAKAISILVMLIINAALFVFAFWLKDKDTKYFVFFLAFVWLIAMIVTLTYLSFSTVVNYQKIVRKILLVFKKEIFWEDIICVRIIEKSDDANTLIALYSKNKKCVYDTSSEFENVWYLVKMAEQKGIEIRKEKDLSLKQISRLK